MNNTKFQLSACRWLIGCLLTLTVPTQQAVAQADERLLLVGVTPGLGIGIYNGIGLNSGFSVRYQHPLGGDLALTATTGLEVFRVKSRYAEWYQKNYGGVTGFTVPVTVGARHYFLQSFYGGLNLGADVSVGGLSNSSFRFEPGVGLVMTLPAGRYIDFGTSVSTSFSQGSGIFSFNVAYGLSVK